MVLFFLTDSRGPAKDEMKASSAPATHDTVRFFLHLISERCHGQFRCWFYARFACRNTGDEAQIHEH